MPNFRQYIKSHIPNNQECGYTIIEMVTVLIIIGLIMVAQFKTSQAIDVAKDVRLVSDFQEVMTAVYAYQDKYKAIPGDDFRATTHLSKPDLMNGNGNGRIDGKWYDQTNSIEAALIWQHLNVANLLGGSVSEGDFAPRNAMGRPIGIQSIDEPPPIVSASREQTKGIYVVCSRGIPGRLVQAIDIKLDDGNPSTGSMMATLDTGERYVLGSTAATIGTGLPSDISPSAEYIVCLAS